MVIRLRICCDGCSGGRAVNPKKWHPSEWNINSLTFGLGVAAIAVAFVVGAGGIAVAIYFGVAALRDDESPLPSSVDASVSPTTALLSETPTQSPTSNPAQTQESSSPTTVGSPAQVARPTTTGENATPLPTATPTVLAAEAHTPTPTATQPGVTQTPNPSPTPTATLSTPPTAPDSSTVSPPPAFTHTPTPTPTRTSTPTPTPTATPPAAALLGGMDVRRHCQENGWSDWYFKRGAPEIAQTAFYGPGYAYDNFYCYGAVGEAPVDPMAACRSTWPSAIVTNAAPGNPDNAFTWGCFGF